MKKQNFVLTSLYACLIITSCNIDSNNAPRNLENNDIQSSPSFVFTKITHTIGDPIPTTGHLKEGVIVNCQVDGDLIESIVIDDSQVDWYTKGIYDISYRVTNSLNNTTVADRAVEVVHDLGAPTLLLSKTEIDYYIGDEHPDYLSLVSEVSDNRDQNISKDDINLDDQVNYEEAGIYKVIYSLMDSDFNETKVSLTVNVLKPYKTPDLIGVVDRDYFLSSEVNLDEFLMFNVSAICSVDGDITNSIEIEHEINLNVPLDYEVTYRVKNEGNYEAIKTCIISVKDDIFPELNILVDELTYIIEEEHPNYLDECLVSYSDNALGLQIEVDDQNVNYEEEGEYFVTYTVTDAGGNQISKTLKVICKRIYRKPIITGVIDRNFYMSSDVNVDHSFVLNNVNAYDKIDGDMTDQIEIIGEVNYSLPGTYEISYSVTNLGDINTTETCIITVIDDIRPSIDVQLETYHYITETAIPDFTSTEFVVASDNVQVDQILVDDHLVDYATPGLYVLSYTIIDTSGNTIEDTLNINVIDLVIEGINNLTLPMTYDRSNINHKLRENLNAYASYDGDLTDQVNVSHSINFDVPGNYSVKYSVTTSYGAYLEKIINVNIYDDVFPIIEIAESGLFIDYKKAITVDNIIGLTVSDNYSVNIKDSLVTNGLNTYRAGYQNVSIAVTDEGGNETKVNTVIFVRFTNTQDAYLYAVNELLSYQNYEITASGTQSNKHGATRTSDFRYTKIKSGNNGYYEYASRDNRALLNESIPCGGMRAVHYGETYQAKIAKDGKITRDLVIEEFSGTQNYSNTNDYLNTFGLKPEQMSHIINANTLLLDNATFNLDMENGYDLKLSLVPESFDNYEKLLKKMHLKYGEYSDEPFNVEYINLTVKIDLYGNLVSTNFQEYYHPVVKPMFNAEASDHKTNYTETYKYDNSANSSIIIPGF